MTEQAHLPDPAAKARLREIAELLRKPHDDAHHTIEMLCLQTPIDFDLKQKLVRYDYWKAVKEQLPEIAALTNNSASTLESVMHPNKETLDLGGITPTALTRLADGGSWRDR